MIKTNIAMEINCETKEMRKGDMHLMKETEKSIFLTGCYDSCSKDNEITFQYSTILVEGFPYV